MIQGKNSLVLLPLYLGCYTAPMYRWIDKDNNTVTTKTIKEFAQMTGMRASNARSLACGHFKRFKNWCSTHRRAKRHRKRFTTELVHSSGKRAIIGPSVTSFCRAHNLSTGHVHKLLAGQKLLYRGWCLAATLDIAQAQGAVPAPRLQNKGTMPHPTIPDAVVGL